MVTFASIPYFIVQNKVLNNMLVQLNLKTCFEHQGQNLWKNKRHVANSGAWGAKRPLSSAYHLNAPWSVSTFTLCEPVF